MAWRRARSLAGRARPRASPQGCALGTRGRRNVWQRVEVDAAAVLRPRLGHGVAVVVLVGLDALVRRRAPRGFAPDDALPGRACGAQGLGVVRAEVGAVQGIVQEAPDAVGVAAHEEVAEVARDEVGLVVDVEGRRGGVGEVRLVVEGRGRSGGGVEHVDGTPLGGDAQVALVGEDDALAVA